MSVIPNIPLNRRYSFQPYLPKQSMDGSRTYSEPSTDSGRHPSNPIEDSPTASKRKSLSKESSSNHWLQITFSVPWIVRNVSGSQDAINIAVSEVGKRVSTTNDRTRNIDIAVQTIGCSGCDESSEAILLVSETALVGLLVRVETQGPDFETAENVARQEIGPHLPNTPLSTISR